MLVVSKLHLKVSFSVVSLRSVTYFCLNKKSNFNLDVMFSFFFSRNRRQLKKFDKLFLIYLIVFEKTLEKRAHLYYSRIYFLFSIAKV